MPSSPTHRHHHYFPPPPLAVLLHGGKSTLRRTEGDECSLKMAFSDIRRAAGFPFP